MRKLLALCAAATLAAVGLGGTAASAQPASPLISEVLVNTVEPTQEPMGEIQGVEVTNPAQLQLLGYEVLACGASGHDVAIGTLGVTTKKRTAIAGQPGWSYDLALPGAIDLHGGVVLVNHSLNFVDAVSFVNSNKVLGCLTQFAGSPNQADVDIAPAAPTYIRSVQRCAGFSYPGTPTFAQLNGLPNGCE